MKSLLIERIEKLILIEMKIFKEKKKIINNLYFEYKTSRRFVINTQCKMYSMNKIDD